ncbi:OB-fold protein [Aestuariivivens sediminicola]|uniref:OB-fold protein n=1 Tax=Aestuariivivens sediminicola TaxID=2913560 RepID=UPI001F58BEE0|nr:hypothetical protein [Aestuariivivens sediminicola]
MKKFAFILIIGIIIFIIGYNYIYQDHRNIEKEKPAFVIDAKILAEQFEIDPVSSETKYLNQTMEISGIVTAINENTIILDNKVFCQFSEDIVALQKDNSIKVKGRFIGYDDLLEEIKLDQCSMSN